MLVGARYIVIILFFQFLGMMHMNAQDSAVHAIKDTNTKTLNINAGLYAGVNNAINYKLSGLYPAPSFQFYFQAPLSRHLELNVGFGVIFYKGKSLNYLESNVIRDTLILKKYNISEIGYGTIPVLLKYRIGRSKIVAGVRWSLAMSTTGTGNFWRAAPPKRDSLVFVSQAAPILPPDGDKIDIGGVIGYEFGISRHLSISALCNIGLIPVFPSGLSTAYGEKIGNYNLSAEVGVHYLLFNYQNRKP
jgi:hypothetical protein